MKADKVSIPREGSTSKRHALAKWDSIGVLFIGLVTAGTVREVLLIDGAAQSAQALGLAALWTMRSNSRAP